MSDALAGLEKAAILLLTFGPETAAAVLRHLSEREVRQVSGAIARLHAIPRERAAAVHEEAWRRLTDVGRLAVDGEQFARQMIDAALGGRDDPARAGAGSGESFATSLEPLRTETLALILGREHPQVMALVLANLGSRKAAAVLAALPEPLQAEIVQRIAELHGVPDDVLAGVGEVLAGQAEELGGAAASPALLGAKRAAEILNVADTILERRVFAALEEQAPAVAGTIRDLMFTFEDLLRIDDRAMQRVLKEIGRDDLMLALRTASPAMRAKISANLSQRAAEMIDEDMTAMGPVPLKDVEQAQARIVAAARQLDAEQRITLGTGGDGVLV